MTTRKKKRVPGTPDSLSGNPSGNLRRESAWAGVRRGDAVEVADTRLRSAKWEFIAHVRNIATGDEWIEVVGGRSGDRKLRSFPPERVFAPAGRHRRPGPRSSLADAPRLPLG
jgi:hypothetical protein